MQTVIEQIAENSRVIEVNKSFIAYTDNYLNFLYKKLENMGLERCPCCGEWKESTEYVTDICNDCVNEKSFLEMFN